MRPGDDMDDVKRAYRAAAGDAAPPPALDDAIRAAARRAVQARPQLVGQGWIGRWRTPLSAAAVMVLAVSVVFVAIEEQPEVAPPALRDTAVSRPAPSAEAAREVVPTNPPRAPVAEKMTAAPAVPLAAPREQAADRAPTAVAAAGSVLSRANPSVEEARGLQAEVQAREKSVAPAIATRSDVPPMPAPAAAAPAPAFAPPAAPAAPVATPVAPAPLPMAGRVPAVAAAPAASPAASPAPALSANLAEAFARQEPRAVADASGAMAKRAEKSEIAVHGAVASRAREAAVAAPAPAAVGAAAPAAAPAVAPSVAMQKSLAESKESAEAWIKRMQQLLKDGKLKETREELARFRKTYPQAVLPPELARLPSG